MLSHDRNSLATFGILPEFHNGAVCQRKRRRIEHNKFDRCALLQNAVGAVDRPDSNIDFACPDRLGQWICPRIEPRLERNEFLDVVARSLLAPSRQHRNICDGTSPGTGAALPLGIDEIFPGLGHIGGADAAGVVDGDLDRGGNERHVAVRRRNRAT